MILRVSLPRDEGPVKSGAGHEIYRRATPSTQGTANLAATAAALAHGKVDLDRLARATIVDHGQRGHVTLRLDVAVVDLAPPTRSPITEGPQVVEDLPVWVARHRTKEGHRRAHHPPRWGEARLSDRRKVRREADLVRRVEVGVAEPELPALVRAQGEASQDALRLPWRRSRF